MWVPCSGRLLLQAGWQEEEELMRVGGGDKGEKKMSNAMSHSALAAWEGDKRRVDRGERERILLHVV